METKPVNIREIDGSEVLDVLNCAYIANRFFGRTRAWFTQRLNNNLVNGKPVSFTPEDICKLCEAFRTISKEMNDYTSNLQNIPNDMPVQVYIISDPLAIDFIQNEDLDGFKEYLDSDDTLFITEPEEFATEAEALAYCSGIGYSADERAPVERYPLRTSEECDLPFIEALKNY